MRRVWLVVSSVSMQEWRGGGHGECDARERSSLMSEEKWQAGERCSLLYSLQQIHLIACTLQYLLQTLQENFILEDNKVPPRKYNRCDDAN